MCPAGVSLENALTSSRVIGYLSRRMVVDAESLPNTVVQQGRRDAPGTLWITVTDGDDARVVPLPAQGSLRFGRSSTCDVVVRNALASREHADLIVADDLRIRDLGSSNGTVVGGHQLAPGAEIAFAPGTAVLVGSACVVVHRVQGRGQREAIIGTRADLVDRLIGAGCRYAGLLKVGTSSRLTPEWVIRLVAEIIGPEDLILNETDGGDIWLVFPRPERAQTTASARVAARRIIPWAFADPGALCVLDGSATGSWGQQINDLSVPLGAKPGDGPDVAARGSVMQRLQKRVDRLAPSSISVLILGETGVGKEVLAATIHERSPRRDGPFLRLNCAALTESLLESELFGHEAGAFTGARTPKVGLIEAADAGTILLDEVGELPLPVQAKLLRVIESREVLRVGSVVTRPVDVRFIAATNRDLQEMIRTRQFREDLYFRLAAFTVRIPPLRERPSEIEPLAHLFAAAARRQIGDPQPVRFDVAAVAALQTHRWPGNIRQLRHTIERAVLLAEGPVICVSDLSLDPERADEADGARAAIPKPFVGIAPADERERISAALETCAGNQTRAAVLLGIARRTLVKKLSRHDLPRPRKSTRAG